MGVASVADVSLNDRLVAGPSNVSLPSLVAICSSFKVYHPLNGPSLIDAFRSVILHQV